MFVLGFLYAVIGVALAFYVFRAYASLSSVFLTSMPLIVVMYRALKFEEDTERSFCYKFPRIRMAEYFILCEHVKVLVFFIYLFLGMVAGFALMYCALPENISNELSLTQMETIRGIRSQVTGNVTKPAFIQVVFENNMRVLAFCILFSFLYGAGAIFILTWNASVIAAAVVEHSSVHFFIHGIPEILAYFMGALAGGIISVAVANHHYKTPEFRRIVADSIDLIVLSILLLVVAALTEAYNFEVMDWLVKSLGLG